MPASTTTTFEHAVELLERAGSTTVLREAAGNLSESGGGRLVLIGGEAGVGKTALLTHFCSQVAPVRVLWGGCDSLFTPRPLGPFLDVAEATGGEFDELVRAGALPHDVASALTSELRRRRPTIVVLEDVHWADGATLDVLRRAAATPALVLAS
jgi:predicted ATPase